MLSDPQRRAAYDAIGAGHRDGERFTPPPDWDAGFEFSGRGADGMKIGEFSDFFAELFGRMGRGARRQARGTYRGDRAHIFAAHGEDPHARIQVDIVDTLRSAKRQIRLRAPQAGQQRPREPRRAQP